MTLSVCSMWPRLPSWWKGIFSRSTGMLLSPGGLAQDAILRQLTVVGEAAYKVSRGIRARHPEVLWAQIAGLRHRVVHDYFGIDLDAIWHFATVELPVLRYGLRQWTSSQLNFTRRPMARKTERQAYCKSIKAVTQQDVSSLAPGAVFQSPFSSGHS